MAISTFKPHSKRHKEEESEILKPFDFCCSPDYIDPLTKYNDKNRFLHKIPFASTNIINGSPVLKFQTHFTGYVGPEQAKQPIKNKLGDIGDHKRRLHAGQGVTTPYTSHNSRLQSRFGSSYINLRDKRAETLKWGPIEYYIEDEITEAKDILWEQKRRIFNEELDRNIKIGSERFNLSMDKKLSKFPSWYQDFSIDQMKNIMMLQCVIRRDCEEMVSGRTERMLVDIGIVSTFFLLTPNIIRKLQETSNCDVIKFLREIYKVLTGNYFEEEEYKHFYDCNERIILSAIAFLTLPETIMELHKRLPPVAEPKLPSKPLPPVLPIRQKKKSPYEDDLFTCTDWASYYNRIQIWRARYQLLPKPKIILPPKECILTELTNVVISREHEENEGERKADRGSLNVTRPYRTEQSPNSRAKRKRDNFMKREEKEEEGEEGGERDGSTNKRKTNSVLIKEQHKGSIIKKHNRDRRSTEQEVSTLKEANKEETSFDIARLPNGSKVFDFTINGVSEKPGPVEYKICGVLQNPRPHNKSWLGEKHPHYIVSGAAENPPSCPITYEMTGVANVTPTNSDEKFFAVLKLGDGPKKIYPSGRKNLSPKWQEWLQNVDEEFRKIEREMQKLIKNIEAVTRLVFPGPKCDNCCSCRQSRKSYIKGKDARTPYFVIDTIAEDSKKNKCIIGSMAMHSPAPTPPESTVNLLEVIASEDVLTTKLMINGITNSRGETQYYISGITDEIIHQPSRIVERPPPAPPRNVPPCECAIQQISAKGLTQEISHDHIPWTKEDGLCFGKKFRPHEAPAVSCKMYPGDKSCRRNPFYRQIVDMKRRLEERKRKSVDLSEKKRMYSIADFPPCGDEHGMSICGAPWGRLHTLTPQELEELEKLRKQILRGPPCGTKPGRAVCKGPFGERIPRKKPAIDLKEIPGEFDEDEEEEEEEEVEKEVKETKVEVVKEKERKRDQKCLTSPDILASKQETKEKKAVKKFIPDPLYPGYDDTWNIHRTAPSKKESETDFKALLKLSSPKPPATPAESKSMMDDREKFHSPLPKNTSKSRKDTEKIAVSRHAKSSQTHSSATNQLNKMSTKRKKKSNVMKDTREIDGKSLGSRAKSEETVFDKSTKRDETRNNMQPTQSKVDGPRTKGNGKATVLVKQIYKNSSLNSKTEKRSFHGKPSKKIEAKSKPATGLVLKQARDNESKISKKSEKSDNKNRSGTAKNKSSPNKNSRVRHEREKGDKVFNLSKKKHRRKDSSNIENESIDPRKQILDLKKVLMSPDNYPPNVKPVDLPEELQTKCAHEYGHLYTEDDSTTVVEETAAQLPSKGPCGWRTKSEQQLPTKKTMVYLCEPDYPPETIQVREGGKPCVCRENRAKKKVLMYNIGGLVRGKKDDTDHDDGKLFKKKKNEEDKKLQVIEGIIYHTPPLSPRRSDEYVPEYDLYKCPYDMCLSKRTDENLKYLERFGVPKISASKTFKQNEPCGCNESVDGQDGKAENEIEVFDKNRRELVKGKPPKERWELALKDIGLIDYYTRCRDSMPCWLKCRKFNRTGCGPSSARLVVKRPVCECKYERKILENQEEKIKWKERREKLKSLKKQPFINIENTSRPVVADTKLMISGVKRIPREDEYIDDVKYSITGVVENYTEEPPKPIVSGVRMATPIQTPEPSVEEIPCVCLHRHWSPINIPPGPLPKPEELQRAEDCKRKMATEEAYRQIHVPDKVYDSHGTHSCDKTCNSNSVSDDEGVQEEGNGTMLLSKMSKQRRRSNGTSGQISKDSAEKRSKLRSKSDKSEETMRIIKHSPKKPEQKEIRDPGEKTDIRRVVEPTNSQSPRRTRSKVSKTTKTDSRLQHGTSYSKEKLAEAATDKEDSEISYDPRLMTLVKNELSKLATEGFLFAKLPKCFLLPQLRYWLMYRKGIALSNADRDDSVRKSIVMWNSLDVGNVSRIEPPSIGMTKVQLRKLTFDDAERIKEQIIKKKAIFYSQVRKDRVLYARSMWNTMDYGKFPDTSFKEAYFTYMASKEADGYVFKPWLRSDTRNVVTNSLEKKVELHIMEISRAKKQSILRWSDHFDTRTLKSANASFGRNGRMDFESPDVEKEFPGLYASESAKKSNESDFSDEGGHEKHSKKELLGGKRKEKKDRKDRGYATLEGESSPDEDQETKSPSKSKKTKAFKFPSKKEKREKSREKETKEKDVEKEKDKKKKDKDEKDVDKEKRKEKEKDKAKQKLKDRKKGKHTGEDCLDIGEAQPVFGVSLHLAVDRSRCHDGVELPLVVRDCIDFVEENGMSVEALYKVPGVKSKVQYLKKLYNNREHVNISEFEPTVATSLLILFLRELPEPVLENSETISRFEQAASTKDVAQREGQLIQLTQQLPECNKVLLAWVILHLDHVTAREKTTKMNAQTISMTLSPVLQMSHRLLLALLFHCKALFPNVLLTKYVPPLSSGSVNLPDTVETIAAELSKQESLLSQIHKQMNAGFVTKSREEQLWEVQRVITQLKRKYKTVQKMEGATQKSLDEEVKTNDETIVESNVQKSKVEEEDAAHVKSEAQTTSISTLKSINKVYTSEDGKEAISINSNQNERSSQTNDNDIVDSASEPSTLALQSSEQDGAAVARASESASTVESEPENVIDKLRESLIYEELLNMQALLKSRINQERNEIKRLTEMLSERGPEKKKSEKPGKVHSPNEAEWTAMIQLVKENQLLEKKMTTLIRSIIEEKDACIELRVQLAVQQLTART